MDGTHHLRVLIANQRTERLAVLAGVVTGLGHEVIARSVHVDEVAAVTARERPDVALVGLGESSDHALQLISEIVRGAFCPVIALLETYNATFIDDAAARGIYSYIVDTRPEELQSAIDITLRRYAEFQNMQGAFERSNAEALRESDALVARQRDMLGLHDGVVQGLVAAELALALNQTDQSRDALVGALENARATVGRSLDELRSQGIPLAELLGDTAPVSG